MIGLPTKSGRRRVLWLVLVFLALMGIERALNATFGLLVGYDFDTHPLGIVYRQFIRVINAAFALLVLIASVRALRGLLPKLYVLMAGLVLLTVWTAVVLLLAPSNSSWAFRASMWHMAAGQLATPLLCAYIFHHVLVYFPAATREERRAGLQLAAFTVIVLLIGAFFSVVGGPELLPFLRVHGLGACLIPPLVLIHVRDRRRGKRKDAQYAAATSTITLLGSRGLTLALRISVIAPVVFLGFSEDWFPKPLPRFSRFFEPLPKDRFAYAALPFGYERPAGEGPFLPSRMSTETDHALPARFLDTANGCSYEGCHTDIGKHWAVSGHRHGRNVFVEKVMDEMRAERGAAATRFCAGCHDPVNLLSGEVRRGGQPVVGPENEGVTCLVCHAAGKVGSPPGNGSLTLSGTPVFFRRLVERNQYLMTVLFLDDHKAELYHSALLRQPEMCGACHVQEVVHDGSEQMLVVQDKVADWKAGIHSKTDGPKGLRTCVDCHMPPVMESYQGRVVRSHRFLSSNTGVPAYYAGDVRYETYSRRNLAGIQQAAFTHAENVELSQAHLKSAVTLGVTASLEPSSRSEGPARVSVLARVSNDGVGHKFPAGAADLIDAWLQLEAVDDGGVPVGSSGVPDSQGRLPPETARFGTEWFDQGGRKLLHHELWKLAEIRDDRRISSGDTAEVPFEVSVPASATWPLHVRVRLRHRRFNPEFAEWAIGADASKLPITDVQERAVVVTRESG